LTLSVPVVLGYSRKASYTLTKIKYNNILPLSRNESGRFGALKSDSTHYFFRNACTKSGSLRFSQFSGCWLILSVYIPEVWNSIRIKVKYQMMEWTVHILQYGSMKQREQNEKSDYLIKISPNRIVRLLCIVAEFYSQGDTVSYLVIHQYIRLVMYTIWSSI
jgi:hypothetical protein